MEDAVLNLKSIPSLEGYVKQTDVVRAPELSRLTGRDVWLKLESQQPTSSFKVRPAFAGILSQLEAARLRGVITTSSGNFAQAVAYAGQKLGVRTCIVMTDDTAPVKVQKTRDWGAEVVFCGTTFESRFEVLKREADRRGSVVLHGFDSEETIAGNAGIGQELASQMPGPFSVVAPVSGGGLISGIALALRQARPDSEVWGAQPETGGAMAKSIAAGRRINVGKVHTLADALVASMPGERTFEIARKTVAGFGLVSEVRIRDAVRTLWREGYWVEPGGAVSVAALLSGRVKPLQSTVVCVLSGANVDPETMQGILQG